MNTSQAAPWPWGDLTSWVGKAIGGWEHPEEHARQHQEKGGERQERGRRGGFGPPWMAMGQRGPGGHWGGPPPFGPGFGPLGFFFGGHKGQRGPHGPRARKGDVRTGILLLLAESPRSGYEIIREGRERSGGVWRPSPGSVYPMLQQLEDEGLVGSAEATAEGGRRRPFELTAEGRAYVEEHTAQLRPPWEVAAEDTDDDTSELRGLSMQLLGAVMQVSQAGSPGQVERAKRLLADTRRDLYRILAEEEGEGGTDSDSR